MVYNIFMEKFKVTIIGGGAVGLTLAAALSIAGKDILLLERGERLGRKLAATGNGQGNVSNSALSAEHYFSSSASADKRLSSMLCAYDGKALEEFYASLGVLLRSDERGRTYPASRQASSLSDALRFRVSAKGVNVKLGAFVSDVEKTKDGFFITAQTQEGERRYLSETVVLCTGGKAAKNFGTDGAGYGLAQKFGHTLTPLYPSLVQLKCDVTHTKTLKGIRLNDAKVTALSNGVKVAEAVGDIIFTDYGVSGDAIFRLSAFIADKIEGDVRLQIDMLPTLSQKELCAFLTKKRNNCPEIQPNELLGGILNNQVGRAVCKRYANDVESLVEGIKNFTLQVKGSLGFDYAQVTKGGVRFDEVNENLQSKKAEGLYLAGEILDIDGECGGYNLHFAFASAFTIAQAIDEKFCKGRGQV